MTFLEKIEAFKLLGYYNVQFYYGESIGCDDMEVPVLERSLKIFAFPVGCLGELMVAWSGKVGEFFDFEFSKFPEELSNPPGQNGNEKIRNGGWYVWGAGDIKLFREKTWCKLQGKTSNESPKVFEMAREEVRKAGENQESQNDTSTVGAGSPKGEEPQGLKKPEDQGGV